MQDPNKEFKTALLIGNIWQVGGLLLFFSIIILPSFLQFIGLVFLFISPFISLAGFIYLLIFFIYGIVKKNKFGYIWCGVSILIPLAVFIVFLILAASRVIVISLM